MMSTAPPFIVTLEQATRLGAYIQTYRQRAFASILPSVERNSTLRTLQTLQGKLIEAMDKKTVPVQLLVSKEESVALKSVVQELLIVYARQAESNERNTTLADLVGLKNSLRSY